MKSFQPDPGQFADMQSSTYITPHLGANPTLATYMATPLLAFNLRIAAYLLTLTLAGAVTHSPPPILAAADVDVEENIVLNFSPVASSLHQLPKHQSTRKL